MPLVLVSDTSVLIDLHRGDLLEAALGLPHEFAVPDLLFDRELRGTQPSSGLVWMFDKQSRAGSAPA